MPDRTRRPTALSLEPVPFPDVETAVLPNGLPVYFARFGTVPIVELSFVVPGGFCREPRTGVARATVAMLSEGTRQLTAEELARRLDGYGAFFHTDSGYEITAANLSLPAKHLSVLAPTFHEIVSTPGMRPADFDLLKKRRMDELTVEQTRTSYRAGKIFVQRVFGQQHPYAAVLGVEDWQSLNLDEIVRYHADMFFSDEAFVVATGNFDENVLLKSLERTLGTMRLHRAAPSSELPPLPDFAPPKRTREIMPDKAQSSIRIGMLSIPRIHPDHHPLRFTALILGGYFGSRLMSNIREEKGYTYGISATLRHFRRAGLFTVACDAANEYVESVVSETCQEIERMRQDLVPADELETARNYLLGRTATHFETPEQLSHSIQHYLKLGVPFDDFQAGFEIIAQTDAQTVREMAQKHWNVEQMVEVVAGGD
jgi:predicted Zn-dependent peptidase